VDRWPKLILERQLQPSAVVFSFVRQSRQIHSACVILCGIIMNRNKKRWQFGLRDVILWSSMICLAGGWINDHLSNRRNLSNQRVLYEDQLERLRESNARQRRELQMIRPRTSQPARFIFPSNTTCATCGESAATRPPNEMWYSWDETQDAQYCEQCAAHISLKAATQ
jgi:hypothetical protein